MYERFNTYTHARPRMRKIGGWLCVIVGFVALVTPLTPGGILFFLGLELLGLRFIGTEKVKQFFAKKEPAPKTVPVTSEVSAP